MAEYTRIEQYLAAIIDRDTSNLPKPETRIEQYLYYIAVSTQKIVRILGVTTTPLYDGASTNPITIAGESVTAVEGDLAAYESAEYLYNGTIWQFMGDLSDVYTKSETDNLLATKADKSTTYAKTETDTLLSAKVDIADVTNAPTTAEINAAITNIWG